MSKRDKKPQAIPNGGMCIRLDDTKINLVHERSPVTPVKTTLTIEGYDCQYFQANSDFFKPTGRFECFVLIKEKD